MKQRLQTLCIVAALCSVGSTACTTTASYASRYSRLGTATGPGIMPAEQLVSMLEESQEDRRHIVGDEALARQYARCFYFRNQLVIASEDVGMDMSSTASDIKKAAKNMELAFQDNDEKFLATCEKELNTSLGRAFANAITAAGLE